MPESTGGELLVVSAVSLTFQYHPLTCLFLTIVVT